MPADIEEPRSPLASLNLNYFSRLFFSREHKLFPFFSMLYIKHTVNLFQFSVEFVCTR